MYRLLKAKHLNVDKSEKTQPKIFKVNLNLPVSTFWSDTYKECDQNFAKVMVA